MTAPAPAFRPQRRQSAGWIARHAGRAGAGLLLAALAWAPAPALAQQSQETQETQESADQRAGYIADVADLPLMDGLREVAQAGMAFDKPSGRIVEAYAHGAVMIQAVRRFYRETLPQLGWRTLGARPLRARGRAVGDRLPGR